MILTCKVGTNRVRSVNVNPDDQIFTLMDKLGITDKKTVLIHKGSPFQLCTFMTFREAGITYDTTVYISVPALATFII